MRGSPIIAMDNCELPLEGVLLNQALTQQRVELRILGFSEMIVAQTMTLLTATGNNLVVKGDLTRRSIVSRLDPKVAQPELRDFAYDPIADAKENRGELVAAVLTALMAYHVAGRPKRPSPPLQSFVKWSNTVRGALLWLGQGDPVGSMARLREADPTIINLKAVLTAWRDEFSDQPTTAKDAVDAADATMATRELGTLDRYVRTHTHPALRAALLLVAGRGGAINVGALGPWLGKHVDCVVDLGDGDFVAFERLARLRDRMTEADIIRVENWLKAEAAAQFKETDALETYGRIKLDGEGDEAAALEAYNRVSFGQPRPRLRVIPGSADSVS
jgi:hypothetical protein